jgi:hypothetical protein
LPRRSRRPAIPRARLKRLSKQWETESGGQFHFSIYNRTREVIVSDGREEREEREKRIEQEKREDREDRVNRDDPDEWKPERVDS